MSEWKNHAMLDTLAAAYAEAGDFDEAVEWQEKAMGFVPTNRPDWKDFMTRLRLYRAKRPYRDEPKGR